MRALQAIGMGLVLVVLNAPIGDPGLDLVPDPLGWLLVLLGVRRLPARVGHHTLLQTLAGLAGIVSVVLWVPPSARGVQAELDESLRWALDLPTPLFVLVLALALGAAAGDRDPGARTWWRVVLGGAVATIALPPVVYGAGVTSLALLTVALAIGTLVTCLVLCFAHSARPWVLDAVPASDD